MDVKYFFRYPIDLSENPMPFPIPPERRRKIVCAAIRFPDGQTFLGVRHFDAYMRACLTDAKISTANMAERGFIDNLALSSPEKKQRLLLSKAVS